VALRWNGCWEPGRQKEPLNPRVTTALFNAGGADTTDHQIPVALPRRSGAEALVGQLLMPSAERERVSAGGAAIFATTSSMNALPQLINTG
jgi:hypothetical protein